MDQARETNNTNTKTNMYKDTNPGQGYKLSNLSYLQLLGEISKRISPKPDPDMIDNHNQSLLKSTTAL